MTRKVKVFHIGRDLFKAERQILRCRELTLANPLALDIFVCRSTTQSCIKLM